MMGTVDDEWKRLPSSWTLQARSFLFRQNTFLLCDLSLFPHLPHLTPTQTRTKTPGELTFMWLMSGTVRRRRPPVSSKTASERDQVPHHNSDLQANSLTRLLVA